MIDEVNPSGATEEASTPETQTPTPTPDAVASDAPVAEMASETASESAAIAESSQPQPVEPVAQASEPVVVESAPETSIPEEPAPAVFDMPVGNEEPALPEAVSAVEITESGSAIAESDTTATVIPEESSSVANDAGEAQAEVVADGDAASDDENFIKEKASQVRAAKKKATTPRTRAPRKTKEKLPDLGDGSGYEPPDPPIAGLESTEATEVQDDALWYAVHCYSGYENKVKHSLEQRIETMGMAGRILEVVVPTEEEIEVRDGKRKTVERRVFPGYVIVRMRMSEDSWHVVRNTPGVTRFIGMGNRPQPLTPPEVNQILKRMEAEAPKIKVNFKTGQKVRITDGPFADLMGLVDRIDTEHAKVVVLVNFFGRDTPVELDFLQVEKM